MPGGQAGQAPRRTGDKRPPAVDVAVGDHVLCRGGGSAQEGCCSVSVAKVLGLRKDSAGELYMQGEAAASERHARCDLCPSAAVSFSNS